MSVDPLARSSTAREAGNLGPQIDAVSLYSRDGSPMAYCARGLVNDFPVANPVEPVDPVDSGFSHGIRCGLRRGDLIA